MSAGKVPSALLHRSIQALFFYKFRRLGRFQGFPQFCIRGIGISPQQIAADRTGKKLGFLLDNGHGFAQHIFPQILNRHTFQIHRAFRGIIKPGDQAHQSGLAAAGTADDTQGLSFFQRKGNTGNGFRTGTLVLQCYIPEFQNGIAVCSRFAASKLHGAFCVQNLLHTAKACHGLAQQYDQIGKLHQLDEDLADIVDHGHQIAPQQHTALHLACAHPEHSNDHAVDHHIGQGIEHSRNSAHIQLAVRQFFIDCRKLPHLGFFPAKGTNHSDTVQVFPGCSGNIIQIFLCLLVFGIRDLHNTKYDHKQHSDRRHKNQRQLGIEGKDHDHSAEHDKRRPQKQAQEHIDAVLHLVDIAGHAGDQGGSTDGVQFCKTEVLDMEKQIPAQACCGTDGCFGSKKLGGKAAAEAQQRHQQHQGKITPDDLGISRRDAVVNDPGNQQRHRQVKARLQHFESRCQNALPLIFFHIRF